MLRSENSLISRPVYTLICSSLTQFFSTPYNLCHPLSPGQSFLFHSILWLHCPPLYFPNAPFLPQFRASAQNGILLPLFYLNCLVSLRPPLRHYFSPYLVRSLCCFHCIAIKTLLITSSSVIFLTRLKFHESRDFINLVHCSQLLITLLL